MKRFSKWYNTYNEWAIDNTQDTEYTRRIKRLHSMYPHATLTQLQGHTKKGEKQLNKQRPTPVSKRTYNILSPREKLNRNKSLKVVDEMRTDKKSLTKASKDNGISPKTVRRAINVLERIYNKWPLGLSDKVPDKPLKIYEHGRIKHILVNRGRASSAIGQYFNAVRKYLDTGDESVLKQFKKMWIRDAKGRIHRFETRPEVIERIEESREDAEMYEVYDY
jgi:hypothetical protein